MDRCKRAYRFEFNNDTSVSNHISPIITYNMIFIVHFKWNFCLNIDTSIAQFDEHSILIDFLFKAWCKMAPNYLSAIGNYLYQFICFHITTTFGYYL